MRKLCIFVGLTAVVYKVYAIAVLALFLWPTVFGLINFAVAATVSYWFLVGDRLAERANGAQWVVLGFGGAGALAFLERYLANDSLFLIAKFGFVGSTVVSSVVDAALLLFLLKFILDLGPRVAAGTPGLGAKKA